MFAAGQPGLDLLILVLFVVLAFGLLAALNSRRHLLHEIRGLRLRAEENQSREASVESVSTPHPTADLPPDPFGPFPSDENPVLEKSLILAALDSEFERFKRYGTVFSALLIDVDGMGSINRQLGWDSGELAMRELSEIIVSSSRRSDKCGRLDSDEFLILLPQTNSSQAMFAAEKIRAHCAEHHFEDFPELRLTVSIGVGSCPNLRAQSVVEDAATALSRAKEAGRNRTALTTPSSERLRKE